MSSRSHFYIGTVDISALKAQLQDQSLYGKYNFRREFYASPHTSMTDIWVRYNKPEAIGEHFNDEHSSIWYPVIEQIPAVLPIVMQLMKALDGERLGGVLITKLPPGGKIESHIDSGWHAGYYDKFYVAVQNGEGSVFGFPDGEIKAKEGEVWQFDNSVPHWVENNSDTDRISMIVCIRTLQRSLSEH